MSVEAVYQLYGLRKPGNVTAMLDTVSAASGWRLTDDCMLEPMLVGIVECVHKARAKNGSLLGDRDISTLNP